MTRLKCEECGRSYWYEEDDFCPKCGAYNQPPKTGGGTVVRVDGVNESGHIGSFSHREVHQEKAQRRALKMDDRSVFKKGPARTTTGSASQSKKNSSGLVGIIAVLVWLFIVMQLLRLVM